MELEEGDVLGFSGFVFILVDVGLSAFGGEECSVVVEDAELDVHLVSDDEVLVEALVCEFDLDD